MIKRAQETVVAVYDAYSCPAQQHLLKIVKGLGFQARASYGEYEEAARLMAAEPPDAVVVSTDMFLHGTRDVNATPDYDVIVQTARAHDIPCAVLTQHPYLTRLYESGLQPGDAVLNSGRDNYPGFHADFEHWLMLVWSGHLEAIEVFRNEPVPSPQELTVEELSKVLTGSKYMLSVGMWIATKQSSDGYFGRYSIERGANVSANGVQQAVNKFLQAGMLAKRKSPDSVEVYYTRIESPLWDIFLATRAALDELTHSSMHTIEDTV